MNRWDQWALPWNDRCRPERSSLPGRRHRSRLTGRSADSDARVGTGTGDVVERTIWQCSGRQLGLGPGSPVVRLASPESAQSGSRCSSRSLSPYCGISRPQSSPRLVLVVDTRNRLTVGVLTDPSDDDRRSDAVSLLAALKVPDGLVLATSSRGTFGDPSDVTAQNDSRGRARLSHLMSLSFRPAGYLLRALRFGRHYSDRRVTALLSIRS